MAGAGAGGSPAWACEYKGEPALVRSICQGIDLDCDGQIDIDFDLGEPGNICVPTPIDANYAGVSAGLDRDCDGPIDMHF